MSKENREVGIVFELMWNDDDVDEISIRAWNGSFGGVAEVYVCRDELTDLAARLVGFPQGPLAETRESFGSLEPGAPWGRVDLIFRADRRGLCTVIAAIASRPEFDQHAKVALQVEPVAIDQFVMELRSLGRSKSGSARLRAIDV